MKNPFYSVPEFELDESQPGVLRIRHRWQSYGPRSLLCAGFFLAITFLALLIGQPEEWSDLIPLGVIASPVYWVAAAVSFNSTYVEVTAAQIAWRHGPVPWARGRALARPQVAALRFGPLVYTKSLRSRRARDTMGPPTLRTSSRYRLAVRLVSGKERPVLLRVVDSRTMQIAMGRIAATLGGDLPIDAAKFDAGSRY
ncbi:MAG: hypothetical protein K2Q23_17265 [Bryobacteraceae bacterium]|nr:hypothetical protein [Bryobacteraceae bacterium]